MEYEQIGERMALSNIYGRWTEFMKYVNHKVGSIHDHFIREYANFVANVALRFGGLDAIYRAPEIPNEAIGEYVREYEKMLVEWSNHLANIERREARFLADEEKRAADGDEADDSGHGEVGDNGCNELSEDETAPAEDEKTDTPVKEPDPPAEKALTAGSKKGGRKPRP
jgi:hypothetical protein